MERTWNSFERNPERCLEFPAQECQIEGALVEDGQRLLVEEEVVVQFKSALSHECKLHNVPLNPSYVFH